MFKLMGREIKAILVYKLSLSGPKLSCHLNSFPYTQYPSVNQSCSNFIIMALLRVCFNLCDAEYVQVLHSSLTH